MDRKGRDWEMKERGQGFRGDLPLNVLSGQKGAMLTLAAHTVTCDESQLQSDVSQVSQ